MVRACSLYLSGYDISMTLSVCAVSVLSVYVNFKTLFIQSNCNVVAFKMLISNRILASPLILLFRTSSSGNLTCWMVVCEDIFQVWNIVNPDIFRPLGLYGTLQSQICRCNRKEGEFQFIIGFATTPNGRRINSLTIYATVIVDTWPNISKSSLTLFFSIFMLSACN